MLAHASRRSSTRRVGGLVLAALTATAGAAPAALASPTSTGPDSSASPYLIPVAAGVETLSVLTVGDAVDGYRLVGIPDGLGAFRHGGRITLLMNHEIPAGQGAVRQHGSSGAFVSEWTIRADPDDLDVIRGRDLIRKATLWDPAASDYYTPSTEVFTRFCSADLAAKAAFWDPDTRRGYEGRIFMNGEEVGPEGRAFAHLLDGRSIELPRLGKISWENSVANPASGEATVVVGLDDTSPNGELYTYIGHKQRDGSAVQRAGLTNGLLYGVSVAGMSVEPIAPGGVPLNTPMAFTLSGHGNVEDVSGAQLQILSAAAGVTKFARPEDGAWDPNEPDDFYFVTTGGVSSTTAPTRLWRLRFADVHAAATGGQLTLLYEGTTAAADTTRAVMLDNLTVDGTGHVLLQEDPGNNARHARIWQYTIGTDGLKEIAKHDPARFTTGVAGFLTQDEESSGIIDASDLLGAGWFLLDVQAHYAIPAELVEGGQLLALYNPDSRP